MSDNLHDEFSKHWAGSETQMLGMILIDSKCYRFMGGKVDL